MYMFPYFLIIFPYTPYNKQKNHTLALSVDGSYYDVLRTAVRLSSYTLTAPVNRL